MGALATLGKYALAVPCQEWQLRKLADAGRVPFVSAGRYRVFKSRDLEAIRAVCREAGYLPPEAKPEIAAALA